MEALLRKTWERVLPDLRSAVGDEAFHAWLESLILLRLERGICHLQAPSRLASERVQQAYAGLIAERLSEAIGTAIDVLVQPPAEALLPDRLEVGPRQPIIGEANRVAALALRALAEGRPMPSCLFFFHGPSGAGKSFLIQWWCAQQTAEANGARPLVFDGGGLLRAFQAAARDRRLAGFVEELAAPGRALVLDEVHRISGRYKLQELVQRVLQERAAREAVTLLASRWHPHEIHDLDDGLATWMLSGFVAAIEHPGPAARLVYLRALEGAASRNGRAAEVERLARDVRGGYPEIREQWARQRVDPAPRKFQLIEPRVTFDRIAKRVTETMDVPLQEVLGPTQKRRVSNARKILAWLCVREGLSRAEVGRFLGRTRAAISYSVQALEREMADDKALAEYVESVW
jgi:chromosomal replication initiation ATPase DnaA